nr:methyl-accepting chemotaxis protein [Methylomarinum sp. Ch1-1]MDP4522232.1 methyl-accepting chemotaxis protein [Methylomarinum sp. Ch1-1]
MKIIHISRWMAVMLAVAMVIFISALAWSLNHLSRAFQGVERYGQLKEQVTRRVHVPINAYLDSGDAALLVDIEENIQRLTADVRHDRALSDKARAVFVRLLETINEAVVIDLRAAGKLADPQVLLVNNENQLADEIAMLFAYVEQSTAVSAQTKQQYFVILGKLQRALQRLAATRRNYFVSSNEATLQTIASYHQELTDRAAELSAYPPLAIYSRQERDNDMAQLLGWDDESVEKVDKSAEHVAEVSSLIKRYPKELRNARRFIEQKKAGRQKTAEQMVEIQQRLQRLGQSISTDYQATENKLYGLVSVCLLLIVAVGVALVLLLRHIAMIINQSAEYLLKLASGDLCGSFRLSSKVTEANQLQQAIAQLREYFKVLISNIDRETATLDKCQQAVVSGTQNMKSIVADQQQLSVISAEQMQQLSLSFQEVAGNAAETRNATTSAQENIEEGVKKCAIPAIRSTSFPR